MWALNLSIQVLALLRQKYQGRKTLIFLHMDHIDINFIIHINLLIPEDFLTFINHIKKGNYKKSRGIIAKDILKSNEFS